MNPRTSSTVEESRGLIAILTALAILGQMSQSLYLPSMPSIDDALMTTREMVKLTLAAFMLSYALGQLIFGPLSDRFGRRIVILWGMVIYLIASLVCTFAPTIEVLIGARFVQGIGACAGLAIVRAVLRDRFEPQQSARAMSYVGMGMALSPAIGPIVGGVLQDIWGWRAAFVAQLLVGCAFMAWIYWQLPETNRSPNPNATNPVQIGRNLATLARDPGFVGYMGVVGFTLWSLYVYMTLLPFVFIEGFGFAASSFGGVFIFTVIGYLLGSFLSSRLIRYLAPHRIVPLGATICLVSAIAMFLLNAAGAAQPWTVVGPMVVFMIGFGLIMPSAYAMGMAPYAHIAGTAGSLYGCVQMGMGALGSFATAAIPGSPPVLMAVLITFGASGAALCYLLLVRRAPPT